MTNSTINSNGRIQRKTLATEIDRLDSMLDGLAEGLNDAVASAVKDVVGQVVREAVEVAVKEVLSNPDLLRAALAQHTPPASQAQAATPKEQRRSFKDMLKGGWNWLCQKATQAKSKLGQGLTWCVEKLSKGCSGLWNGCSRFTGRCVSGVKTLGNVGLVVWRFRRTFSLVMSAGLICSVCGYYAGPVISALLCGLGGMTLTLSAMILVPLWHLLLSSEASHA